MLEYPNGLLLGNPASLLNLLAEVPAIAVLQSHDDILLILVGIKAPHDVLRLQLEHDLHLRLEQLLADSPNTSRSFFLDFLFAYYFQGHDQVRVSHRNALVDVPVAAMSEFADAEVAPDLVADWVAR